MAAGVGVKNKVPPAIGQAGFWMVIAGLIIPFAGMIGFILCIVGLVQAKRRGLPAGLATAGVAIGVIAIALNLIELALVF